MAEFLVYFFVAACAAIIALNVWIARGGVQRFKDQIDRERRLDELTPIVDHEDLSR
jgi:hypothetical protein